MTTAHPAQQQQQQSLTDLAREASRERESVCVCVRGFRDHSQPTNQPTSQRLKDIHSHASKMASNKNLYSTHSHPIESISKPVFLSFFLSSFLPTHPHALNLNLHLNLSHKTIPYVPPLYLYIHITGEPRVFAQGTSRSIYSLDLTNSSPLTQRQRPRRCQPR